VKMDERSLATLGFELFHHTKLAVLQKLKPSLKGRRQALIE